MREQSKYDFDTVVDRRNDDSIKWKVAENELPMWVADMDFQTAPEILEVLRNSLNQGVFGYTDIRDSWYDAYIGWWERRHDLKMEKENLFFSTGVVYSISAIIKHLATANENVVVQSPVYNNFYNCIVNSGCNVVENRLLYRDGNYSIDFADLEEKFADLHTNLMILCNPHNPISKVWSVKDLAKIGELAKTYNVTVIADEIHCDITRPGTHYTPFAAVSDTCREVSVTCIAPTKTFNLAGLHTSAVYAPNPALRRKVRRALHADKLTAPNSFATVAAIAAFEQGEKWLECLREYLFENRKLVENFLVNELPEITAVKGDATYLRRKTGLFLIGGEAYGSGGEHFLRMNIACPKSICLDGLNRLKEGVAALLQT